ncbi:MAG TPA: hypothetical protein VN380_14480 [Thermoanaerobaculia bacterium]|jgi:hypothetical protein|nr:hypothetical protein [Thermoanaerobaculia bacterium]
MLGLIQQLHSLLRTYTVDYESKIVTANVIMDVLRQYSGTARPRPFKIVRDELLIGDGKTYLRRLQTRRMS